MQSTERFEKVPIDKLIPYARNARTHSKEQILQLQSSLREFGFVNPILSDADFNIIAGHGRILAAKAEGFTEVPCVFVEHLTDAQKRAYILADNKLSLNAGWDDTALGIEMSELKDLGFDLALTGFDVSEIEKLFGNDDVTDDDFDVDKALEEPPFVQSGDMWTLGRHHLLCGDATKSEDVARLMGTEKVHLYLTDPPYGISYRQKGAEVMKNDDLRGEGLFENLLLPSFKLAFDYLYEGGWGFIFHADTMGEFFRRAYHEAGFHLSGTCIWVKNAPVLGRSPFMWQHEPCLTGFKQGKAHYWFLPPDEARKQTTIWNFDKPSRNDLHATMKPLPLLSYIINIVTAPEMTVYDSFLGSGSTLITCEQMSRRCFGLEIDPIYASVIVKRYIETVGNTADVRVERSGEVINFADIAKGAAQ
ncbi:methyltransferase [Clostridia bacterium]|nr:methyltransferase [Clostridia bacterium]